MASLDLKNEPLGIKHKNYNNILKDAISKNKLEEKVFKPVAKDLDNVIKIDIASKNKNVDYILSVLKSNDMLYISRALKNSEWLVEEEYKDIINPHNLKENLLPQMTAGAGVKLIKLIQKNLKNEARAEEFFMSEDSPKVAAKWLSRCSIPFIEKHVKTHLTHLSKLELKRLCEKSITIFDAALKGDYYGDRTVIEAASFLLNTHVDKYLDAAEKTHCNFNAKSTNAIMKQVPDRIKNQFKKYYDMIHIPTFVKYLKREEIKGFLYQQIDDDAKKPGDINRRFFRFPTMKEFIQRMPVDEQFDFVKELFINKSYLLLEDNNDPVLRGTEKYSACLFSESVCAVNPTYVWYEFAPFDTAFAEIKKLRSDPYDCDKSAALNVLLLCTKGDKAHVQTVLSFYVSELHKENKVNTYEFVSYLIDNTHILKMILYDEALWVLLEKILDSMDFYKEDVTIPENCLEIIIIHNVLKNKPIPEILEKKLRSTLKDYQKKLSREDGDRVFEYLLNVAKKTIDNTQISNQETFNEAISQLDDLFNLLIDWKKEMNDFPFILEKIRDYLKLAKENNWKKSDMSLIYNKNKSWRKLMFEESVMLHPSDAVCVNAIKHDPALLERYKEDVENIRCDDKESLVKLLKKLRIYWPNSLAEDWTQSYIARLDKLGNHKALIRGLCTMLPQKELHDIIVKYAPAEHKVDWNNIDELTLGLQRTIAKNMHIARPKPKPEDVLLYAKGDYLKFALPSLHAIFYSLNKVDSKDEIPKLLDAPVSLQKHGLRLSFVKLDHDAHKLHMSNIWKTTKNSSIRKVVFQLVFDRLIKEKNDKEAQELWELLEVFIDTLSFKDDDKIYKMLPRVSEVPSSVRAKFLKKSYKFLKTLVLNITKDHDTYQYHVDRLEEYTREIMESMPSDFVDEILTEFIAEKFFKYDKHEAAVRSGGGLTTVLSAYLLCAKEEDTQIQRYEKLLSPLLKQSFTLWNETNTSSFYIRRHVQSILKCLSNDLIDYVVKNKMAIPTKMFKKILDELNKLPISENYLMVTKWKLTVKLAELVEKSKESDWEKISAEIGPEFGKICLERLKRDVIDYFSCIYVLFSKAMRAPLQQFPESIQMEIFGEMLSDKDSVQAYLATLNMFPRYINNCGLEAKKTELKEIMASHPSLEVKMHYNYRNKIN